MEHTRSVRSYANGPISKQGLVATLAEIRMVCTVSRRITKTGWVECICSCSYWFNPATKSTAATPARYCITVLKMMFALNIHHDFIATSVKNERRMQRLHRRRKNRNSMFAQTSAQLVQFCFSLTNIFKPLWMFSLNNKKNSRANFWIYESKKRVNKKDDDTDWLIEDFVICDVLKNELEFKLDFFASFMAHQTGTSKCIIR